MVAVQAHIYHPHLGQSPQGMVRAEVEEAEDRCHLEVLGYRQDMDLEEEAEDRCHLEVLVYRQGMVEVAVGTDIHH